MLFIYLTQREPVGNDVLDYIRSKAQEEARRTGRHECVLNPIGCAAGLLGTDGGFVLPTSQVYEDIRLKPGVAEARRSEPGWPAFRQIWPRASDPSNEARGAATEVDVSAVDTTTIADLVCAESETTRVTYSGCLWWERLPNLRIAGVNGGYTTVYVQVKVLPGEEEDPEVVRDELTSFYRRADRESYIVIPVKYDYEELWRWAKVINRFAHTSGNTLGITGAWLGENREAYPGDAVYPLATLPEARPSPSSGAIDLADLRTTIHVMTMERDRTAAALPQLLGQLNIPVDAVGVVVQLDRTPAGRPMAAPGVASANVGAEPGASGSSVGAGRVEESDSRGVSTWVIAGGAGIAGLVVLASVVFLTVRLRRRVI